MTSKVIEGHKSLSNFSVNQTHPLLHGWSVDASPSISFSLPPLSLTFSLYLPLLLYTRNNLQTMKSF